MSHLSNQQISYSNPLTRSEELWENEIARHEYMLNEQARLQAERYRLQRMEAAQQQQIQAYRAAMAKRAPGMNEESYTNWQGMTNWQEMQDYAYNSDERRQHERDRQAKELRRAIDEALTLGRHDGERDQKRLVLELIDTLSIEQMLTNKDPFLQALGKVLASKFVVNA